MGANNLDRNAKVVVKLGDINLMTLDVSGTIIDIRVAENTGDMNMTDANEDESEDESEEIGVLSIAVDLVDVVDAESTETELAAK